MDIKKYAEFHDRRIDQSEYFEESENIIPFTDKEMTIIYSINLRRSIGLKVNTLGYNNLPIQICFYSVSYTEYINKLEDEWFLIKRESLFDEDYFKIDGFDGLINYINKYFRG